MADVQDNQQQPQKQAEVTANPIDVAVAQKMGLYKDGEEPLPFSSDRELVNEMAAFAREHGIQLPRFTSDPAKIANAIAKWEES